MPLPTDSEKRTYMFSDDVKFLQKAIIFHPVEKHVFLTLRRPLDSKSRAGSWDLPGGNVQFGEKAEESLRKEIKEETSLEVKFFKPIQVVTNFERDIYYLFIGYQCHANSAQVALSHEHIEYRWVTKEEFLQLESADFLVKMVKLL